MLGHLSQDEGLSLLLNTVQHTKCSTKLQAELNSEGWYTHSICFARHILCPHGPQSSGLPTLCKTFSLRDQDLEIVMTPLLFATNKIGVHPTSPKGRSRWGIYQGPIVPSNKPTSNPLHLAHFTQWDRPFGPSATVPSSALGLTRIKQTECPVFPVWCKPGKPGKPVSTVAPHCSANVWHYATRLVASFAPVRARGDAKGGTICVQ